MFERLNTPEELFQHQLSGALEMERDIARALDELIESSRDELVKEELRDHQAETRGHMRRLERVFESFGWEIEASPCAPIKAIEKEGKANIKRSTDSRVDSMILGAAIETEHHEMAVYDNLIIHAQALGHDRAAEILERNREEEKAALARVKQLAREHARPVAATPALSEG
jgi:ferritin-like metal-binding protein YciE